MLRRWFEPAALAVLLAIVGLRPLIAENLHTALTPMTAAMDLVADNPVWATLAIDLVILVAALAVLLSRVGRGGATYRRTGLEWGTAALTVAAVIACVAAGEKRPAITAAIDLLAALALVAALVQLLDRPSRVVLTLAVIVASAVANVGDIVDEQVSHEETLQSYLQSREATWTAQGVPLDAPQVQLYEQRMQSREASGFFNHSNVAGGYLLLALFAGLGVGLAAWRVRPWAGGLAAVIVVALVVGLVLTKGTGPAVAALASGGLLAGWMIFARRWPFRRRATFVGGWLLVLLAVVGVGLTGRLRGGLPHPSLDFRWHYWTASAEMFRDHPLVGVGPENFGDAYLRYKDIASPEEVKNPHNLLVQFATEYGGLGLIAAIMLLIGGSWRLTGPLAHLNELHSSPDPLPTDDDWVTGQRLLAWGVFLAAMIFLPRMALLGNSDAAYLVWMTGSAGLAWAAGFVLTAFALRGGEGRHAGGVAHGSESGVDRRGGDWRWLAAALNAGLFAFLLQDSINFAFFVPGVRICFCALLAVALALRHRPGHAGRRQGVAAWTALATCGIVLAGLLWALPTSLAAERLLRASRQVTDAPAATLADHPAHQRYLAATARDPWDASAPIEHARWLMRHAGGDERQIRAVTDAALAALNTAIARAPDAFELRSRLARLLLLRGQVLHEPGSFERAVEAMRQACALYPTRPMSYVELGDCLAALDSCAGLRDALDAYRHALALDDARPAWETLRRFNPRVRAEVEARIAQLLSRAADRCGTPD